MFNEGKFNILPAFFKTLVALKKQKREFAIVLRSNKGSFDKFVLEYNKMCAGLHPCFNGKSGNPLIKFDGSKGSKDMAIKDKNMGVLCR
jgi:hypothetical protein